MLSFVYTDVSFVEDEFALVLGVFTHAYGGVDRVFLYVCWLKDMGPDPSFGNRVHRFRAQKMPFEEGHTAEEAT